MARKKVGTIFGEFNCNAEWNETYIEIKRQAGTASYDVDEVGDLNLPYMKKAAAKRLAGAIAEAISESLPEGLYDAEDGDDDEQ